MKDRYSTLRSCCIISDMWVCEALNDQSLLSHTVCYSQSSFSASVHTSSFSSCFCCQSLTDFYQVNDRMTAVKSPDEHLLLKQFIKWNLLKYMSCMQCECVWSWACDWSDEALRCICFRWFPHMTAWALFDGASVSVWEISRSLELITAEDLLECI